MAEDAAKTTSATDPETTGDGTGAGDGPSTSEQPFISFASESDFQKAIDERLKNRLEREQKKAESQAQKAREEAEAKALAEQQEWQKLAEKHAAKVGELETATTQQVAALEAATTRAERLTQALQAQLTAQRDGLPESVLELLDKLEPVDQLEYLAKHRAALTAKPSNGVPASPNPADTVAITDEQKQAGKRGLNTQIRNWM